MPPGRLYDPIPKPRRRRRDPDRFDGLPLDPGHRVKDEQVLAWARARGLCEWCGLRGPTEPHHLRARGMGGKGPGAGGDTYDNVAALCRPCHQLAHTGQISRDQLRAAIARR